MSDVVVETTVQTIKVEVFVEQPDAATPVVVDIGRRGERGPAGPPGTAIPIEPPQPTSEAYITHNLGRRPLVQVRVADDIVAIAITATTTYVSFSFPYPVAWSATLT